MTRRRTCTILYSLMTLLILGLLMTGCRSAKVARKPEVTDYLTAKIELTVPSKDAVYTINGTLKAHRGEIIQMSFLMPILRTEIARIEATPADILFLDRMNHRYAKASASSLSAGYDLSGIFAKLDESLFKEALRQEKITLTPEQIGIVGLKKGQLILTDFSFEPLEVSPTQFSASRYQEVKAEQLLQLLMSL